MAQLAFLIVAGLLTYGAWQVIANGLQVSRQKTIRGAPAAAIGVAMLAGSLGLTAFAFWGLADDLSLLRKGEPTPPATARPNPLATASLDVAEPEPIAITITAAGEVMFEGGPLTPDELEKELRKRAEGGSPPPAVILAHPQASIGHVQEVITRLMRCDFVDYTLRKAPTEETAN